MKTEIICCMKVYLVDGFRQLALNALLLLCYELLALVRQ